MQVEATKFTEVGFHGRDVDQIIRDLVDNAILLQRQKVPQISRLQYRFNGCGSSLEKLVLISVFWESLIFGKLD